MTTQVETHGPDNGRLASLHAEVAALPEEARVALLEHAIVNLPPVPSFCGLILTPTQFETDLRTIAGRASVSVQLLTTQALNKGDSFQVQATLKNCTGFRLQDAQLVAGGTQFASVTSAGTVDVGPIGNGSSASTTFQCKAIAVTPTLGGPPDPLIRVSARLVLDLTSATGSASVMGEIFPA